MSPTKPTVRCSSLDQLLECPGSRTLNERIRTLRAAAGLVPDPDDSGPHTWAGNWCHWEAARRLIRDHGAICTQGLPEHPSNIPADFQPSDFDRWCVEYYVSKVLDYVGPDMAIEVENELCYDLGPCFLSGHQDLFAISFDGRRGVGADLKRGANPVDPAAQNWQMSGYTVLDKIAYPDLEHMTYLIIQPGIPETDVTQRVSSMVLEGEELAMLPEFLAGRIVSALTSARSLSTGWRQCLYCLAANTYNCPALEAELEAMKMELTEAALEAVRIEPDNEKLGRWKIGQKLLTKHLESASDLLKERVAAAGGALVTEAGSFALRDHNLGRVIEPIEGWNRLCDIAEAHAKPEAAYKCITISPPDVIETIAELTGLPKKTKSKDPKVESAEKQFLAKFGDIAPMKSTKALVVTS